MEPMDRHLVASGFRGWGLLRVWKECCTVGDINPALPIIRNIPLFQ